jgi:hypothetical protein
MVFKSLQCSFRKSSSQLPELALIVADIPHFVRAGTTLIKPQIYPLLDQLLRQLRSNYSLSKTQDLRIVAQHGSLDGVWVMGSDRSDALDFVR